MSSTSSLLAFFFFDDTAPPEIYTLSLHDALPISRRISGSAHIRPRTTHRLPGHDLWLRDRGQRSCPRSEEHTSELQSRPHLVCRLLLEKKKKTKTKPT